MRYKKLKNFNFKVDFSTQYNFWKSYDNFTWEPEYINFIITNSKLFKVFIDIGSWIGPYSLLAANLGMKVYAYEPDKVAFQELKKNVNLNEFKYKPQIFNFALSNSNGEAVLYSKDGLGKSTSSIINNKINGNSLIIKKKFFYNCVDKIIKDNNKILPEKFFLKIDIEGHEFNFESSIYKIVKKYNLTCFINYHFFIFNRNKILKFYHKIKTIFFQILVKKIIKKKLLNNDTIFRKY